MLESREIGYVFYQENHFLGSFLKEKENPQHFERQVNGCSTLQGSNFDQDQLFLTVKVRSEGE